MRRSLAVCAALLLGSGPACLLRLDDEIACGDGFVDARAGEECDPAVPSSYENACPNLLGTADCDPNSCLIINDANQCSVCGDSRVDASRGEECDGDNLGGDACPGGGGALQCNDSCMLDYSECDACGNGMIDEGEECDMGAAGGLGTARPCGGTNLGSPDEIPPLPSPTSKDYTSGQTTTCRTDCRYDRSGCGFCGDGVQDGAIPVQQGDDSAAEWCDGVQFDPERLATVFGPLCDDPASQRPSVSCGDDCQSFTTIANGCCLRRNAACPEDDPGPSGGTADGGAPTTTDSATTSGSGSGTSSGSGDAGKDTAGGPVDQLECCYGLANPDAADPCYSSFEAGGVIRRLCR